MKTILGAGQLGLAIMQLLLDKNPDEKILVNRSGKLATTVPNNVQVVVADVTSKTDMEDIANRSELIFSCTDMPYQIWSDFLPGNSNRTGLCIKQNQSTAGFCRQSLLIRKCDGSRNE